MNILHGWLAVYKESHITSHQIVQKVRRYVKPLKVGHGGTLDSLATGILPIALGEATKTVAYVMDCDKEYEFEVTWGESRETDDAEGAVIERSEKRPTREEILAILPHFTGEILQRPPVYSALKIQGKRASDRARAAEDIQMTERPVKIESLELVEMPDSHRACFRMTCHKGTYVRSLARDMAVALGTLGYASKIHRSRVGPFTKENALMQEKLANEVQIGLIEGYVHSIPSVLDDISAAEIDKLQAHKLYQGNKISLRHIKLVRGAFQEGEMVLCLMPDALPVALSRVEGDFLYPQRVFNLKRKRETDVDHC